MNAKRFALLLISTLSGLLNLASAQGGCNDGSFFLTKGTKWVYSTYVNKELVSKNVINLDTVFFLEDRTIFRTKQIASYKSNDEMKNSHKRCIIYICNGRSIRYRPEGVKFKNIDDYLLFTGTPYLRVPNELRVGDNLEGQIVADYHGSGTTTISNRKVEGYDTLKSTAGIFDCFLITYELVTKSSGVSFNRFVKEWYSKEVGLVRVEYYNKRRKLKKIKVLTEFSK